MKKNFIWTKKFESVTSGEKALTSTQVHQLLEHITDLRDLALIQLALSAGIRRNDIVKIKVDNIDFTNQSLTFNEQKKRRVWTTYLSKSVMNTLEMLVRINKNEVYLFPGSAEKIRGKGHVSSKTAYNILQRYLKRAGLPPRPFHALRASCVKLCKEKGWTIEQTAKHIGDTVPVVQKHYATPSGEEMRSVAEERAIID